MIELFVDKIEDEQIRESLRRLEQALNENPLTGIAWRSYDVNLTEGSNTVRHRLGGIPKHFIVSFTDTPEASISFRESRSDRSNEVIVISDRVAKIRLLLGG